jgi:hypothetical protein
VRRGDGDEAGRRKIEDEGISRIRLGKGDGPVGPAVGPMEVRHGENAAVLGYLSVRKSGEDIEGVSPGCAYAQSVEKGAQGRRERPGRRGPGETLGVKREGGDGRRPPGRGSDHEREAGVQELTLSM